MLNDTLTTIENQLIDGIKAVQDPTIEGVRQAASALGALPFAGDLAARNLAFAQRLLDVQRDFVAELAAAAAPPAPKKRSAA
jgi:hypothetical protein